PVRGVALQGADVDRLALLGRTHAGLLAQDLGRADARAGAAHDVLLQDGDRRAPDIVGRDLADEARDVDAGGARLQAGCVVAEVAAAGVDQRPLAVERRLHVVEVAPVRLGRQAFGRDITDVWHRRPGLRMAVSASRQDTGVPSPQDSA